MTAPNPLAVARWAPAMAVYAWAFTTCGELESQYFDSADGQAASGKLMKNALVADKSRALIAQEAKDRYFQLDGWSCADCTWQPWLDGFALVHTPSQGCILATESAPNARFISSFIEACERREPGKGLAMFKTFWEVDHA